MEQVLGKFSQPTQLLALPALGKHHLIPNCYEVFALTFVDPLLTAKESAAELQISVPTFWRWVANGTLRKPLKLGGMSRWPRSELIEFIEKAKAKREGS